jgi:hypothetical protein
LPTANWCRVLRSGQFKYSAKWIICSIKKFSKVIYDLNGIIFFGGAAPFSTGRGMLK